MLVSDFQHKTTGSVEKILIIRLSAIGDVVMASMLIPALKALFPKARIDWLAEPVAASLLKGHPQLNKVVIWPRSQWRTYLKNKQYMQLIKAFWLFRSQLQQAHYDLVLDVQGLLKSGIWAWLSGAPHRIGLGSKEGSQYLMSEVLARHNSAETGSEYRGLIAHLSGSREFVARYCKMSLTFHDDPIAVAEFSAQLKIFNAQERHVQSGGYVVFCPYTTRPQKHWFDHYWVALSQQITQYFALPCVILGGPDDKANARHLAGQCRNTLSFAGRASLQGSSRIVAGARFVIGVDTGITHMGVMHQVPTIAIFGSTCPYSEALGTKVLYLNKACSPCRRKPICNGRFECLRDITPEAVIAAMQSLHGVTNRIEQGSSG